MKGKQTNKERERSKVILENIIKKSKERGPSFVCI